jgi:hypothetical protein
LYNQINSILREVGKITLTFNLTGCPKEFLKGNILMRTRMLTNSRLQCVIVKVEHLFCQLLVDVSNSGQDLAADFPVANP